MLTEIQKKGGCLCQPARHGKLRCPLIVRPTSEDVVTGNLFGTLNVLDPRRWVSEFLNRGLGINHFRPQVYRRFRIDLWVNKPPYPRELLPWDEGSTQVDAILSWENPATTVYIEMKYGSGLSSVTSRNRGQHGFPADQLSRNARVGLLECGYFERSRLLQNERRDFLLLVVSPDGGQPLVARYRDPVELRSAIPHSERIPRLPKLPFIGELNYSDVVQLLRHQRRWFTRPEQVLVDQLTLYLEMKLATKPRRTPLEQAADLFEPNSVAPAGSKDIALPTDLGVVHAEATAGAASS